MNIGYDFDGVLTKNVLDTNILGERHEDLNTQSTPNYVIIDQIKKQTEDRTNIYIISKNDKERIKSKLNNQLYLPYLISDTNIYANLDSKVDIIKKLNLNQFYDDSVDNIHEINTKLRKQQSMPIELFLVKPESDEIQKIDNENLRVLTWNTNWKNMLGKKDAPNPLCRKKLYCAMNVVDFIKKQLPLDFIFIQEGMTDEFNVLKDDFNFIITKSGPETIHTLINRSYPKPIKVIAGEFEKGRPFHIIILTENLCLINVHFGHNKDLRSELKIIKKTFEKDYDKDKIKLMRIIMAGDFNMSIKDLPRFLNKDFKKTKTKGTCCISGQKFNFVDKDVIRTIYNMKNIDHIFDSAGEPQYSLTLFPFDDRGMLLPASDHLAVFAELKKII